MKNLIVFIASLCLLNNSFGGCTKPFEGTTLYANQSSNLAVPRGYHEDYMLISCSIKNLDYIPYEPVAFLVGNKKIVMREGYIKDYVFEHKHLYNEGDVFYIPLKNYDDFSKVLFFDCKSRCY